MDLFYHKSLENDSKSLKFVEDEFHHITKVMRYKEGDKILISNGRGLIAEAIIVRVSKSDCECEIFEIKSFIPPEKNFLALVPILKNLERFEFALEKLTEIGVNEIIPYYSERSVRKNFRFDRAEKILISALKQSQNPFLPQLKELISFDKFLDLIDSTSLIIFGEYKGANIKEIANQINLNQFSNIIITVGPEGDFSERELELLKSKDGIAVNLGENRLRSETAIIYLLAQLKLLLKV